MARSRPMSVDEREAAIERGCDLYRAGLSLRRAEAEVGVNWNLIRARLLERGETRGRLAFQSSVEDRTRVNVHLDQVTGCWLWLGLKNNMGYGLVSVEGRYKLAHRVLFERHRGPIGAGLDACHTCDNPGCCNPGHIFLGTRADNMRDCADKGRTRRGEACPWATLTDSIVREIRRLHAEGAVQRRIAEQCGVDYRKVNSIIHRRSWAHVE